MNKNVLIIHCRRHCPFDAYILKRDKIHNDVWSLKSEKNETEPSVLYYE